MQDRFPLVPVFRWVGFAAGALSSCIWEIEELAATRPAVTFVEVEAKRP